MTFENKQCRTIEVAHGVKDRNTFINLDDTANWIKQQSSNADLYSSFFRYYTDDPYIGGVLAGFGMDFDDANNPERARKEALTIIKFLMDRFAIKEKDISICFSGNKGFHVFVNHAVLGIEPDYLLPQIFKQMVRELISEHRLKTLDLAIYDRRRLIRLQNTQHQRSGLYKIPLTLTELENSSIDQIKVLAVRPRELIPKVEHEVSENARGWFLSHRDLFKKQIEEKRLEFQDSELKITAVLPCVKKRLELGAEEGMRNRYTWQLASYFCKKGKTLEECLKIMKAWYDGLKHGIELYTWDECEASIRGAYEKGGYEVGCGSEYVEGLCVGKENCPLFTKREESEISEESFQEAEKILTRDPLKFIVDTVNEIHVGDQELIQIEYISALSPRLATPIHSWTIGSSQKGKSHVKKSVLKVLPREHYEIFTSASPQSLFYFCKKYGEDALDGKVLYLDEVEASKLTIPLLRSLTSPGDIEPRAISVFNAELLDMKIRGTRLVWFTSTKPFGDEQMRNRFIFTNPNESIDQDMDVFENQDQIYRQGIKVAENNFDIAKALTKRVLEETKDKGVNIPFRIEWPFKDKRWLYPIFISTIKTITKINFRKRETMGDSITTTVEDFEKTKELWGKFLEYILLRVSLPSKKLFGLLSELPDESKTKEELAEETDYSTQHIGRLLEELLEAELISQRKREHEGRGRHAWEYWKRKLPGIGEIKCIFEHETSVLDSSKKNFLKVEKPKTKNNVQKYIEHIPPAEPCEKCGEYPVEWIITLKDTTRLRRCDLCYQRDKRVY